MIGNYYIYNKLAQEHRYDLSQEAQRERMLKMLRHHADDMAEHLPAKRHPLASSVMRHDSEQA